MGRWLFVEMDNRAIRTNVSIPAWLKGAAEAAGLNYSQVLQQALRERLEPGFPETRDEESQKANNINKNARPHRHENT